MTLYTSMPKIPLVLPTFEFTYDARVDLDPVRDLGPTPRGQRMIVPIRGGIFEGPQLRGRVLAGGADRQLYLSDGTVELDALYEMETEDGVVITVHNRVCLSPTGPDEVYAYSNVKFTVAQGRYDWLNTRQFIGTVERLHFEDPMDPKQVLIRVFMVT
ncbi:hypothetical protein DL1_10880 [Thioclava dalianensis]|uniref:UPF0311 protein DL1_10880 n=1 Tax=Thioclava dalianensis TaxID=1185766 RepID=A0A074THH0_9RHOB|nr:DUF3237 domain-containing protein [Thioclava dalianensis]KEP71146.1 hypothetical protein DL1_10880 [Thioclava dalianensis]SFN23994.1 Protein of unknown function [Thioclava dalianensis]